MLSKQSYVTPRGVTEGRIDVYNYGPGFSKVWFSGIVDAINIATTTPIDDETTQVRFNFIVRKFDDEKLTSTVADAFVKEINKQVQEDRPIWEHKSFLPSPALADTDGPDPQVPQVVQPVLRRALRSQQLTCGITADSFGVVPVWCRNRLVQTVKRFRRPAQTSSLRPR